jgi:hypothetical protein
MRAFRKHGYPPGSATQLEVEVPSPSVVHTISVGKLHKWLDGACRSPNERIAKQRLKELLA